MNHRGKREKFMSSQQIKGFGEKEDSCLEQNAECQPVNVEVELGLEKSTFCNQHSKDWTKQYQWMLNLGENSGEEQEILHGFKMSSHGLLIGCKGKIFII